jgi:uncharacterized protein
MVSLHSGSVNREVELLHIETKEMTVVIKGKPYHEKYEGLNQYRSMDFHDPMNLDIKGDDILSVRVFDINELDLREQYVHRPIFFENGVYQLVVKPKGNKEFTFFHEHQALRNSVGQSKFGDSVVLLGNLYFPNEVGLSTFEIREKNETKLSVTIEIFPTKLDYRNDYVKLLEEVNDEIYNLAFHFIRRTYLGAKAKLEGEPSRAEFYRLMQVHFQKLYEAINRIEKQPHHKLITTHKKVRGDQLGKQDQKGLQYLKKRPHLFVATDSGINMDDQKIMPKSGLNIKKDLTYDNYENRYIKWVMTRLIEKLDDLLTTLSNPNPRYDYKPDQDIMDELLNMKNILQKKVKSSFWESIGKLDRSIMSLVLQMAPGYRDVFKLFLLVSRGLQLQGKIYQMSVKDVAKLYEYWTYLKLGQILRNKYEELEQEQSIIQVSSNGLFVNLQQNTAAKRVFLHPQTKEKITLTYQQREGRLPTTTQIPDTMLSIKKKGKKYEYQYVFDSKYRVDFALSNTSYGRTYNGIPGPMEEDINTMHRYRDSIVVRNNGPFERKAFGAYVLFPWNNEEIYQDHKLYKSIDEVNIGGLPFLPNTTQLVEQFLEHLIDKSPEEIQEEGILPRGTLSEWTSSNQEKVMVIKVSEQEKYKNSLRNCRIEVSNNRLHKGWQEAKYVAMYSTNEITKKNGIYYFGKIEEIEVKEDILLLYVNCWKTLANVIKPVGYGISNYVITDFNILLEAKELPELFMKSKEEMTIWRMLRRLSDNVKSQLDSRIMDKAKKVEKFTVKNIHIELQDNYILLSKENTEDRIPLTDLKEQPSKVFKRVTQNLM